MINHTSCRRQTAIREHVRLYQSEVVCVRACVSVCACLCECVCVWALMCICQCICVHPCMLHSSVNEMM